MAINDKVLWTENIGKAFDSLKSALMTTMVLALPDYSKPFTLTVDCKNGFMTAALLQKHGSRLMVCFLLQETRPCGHSAATLCSVCAAALMVESSAVVRLYHPTTLLEPHAVHVLLLQTQMSFYPQHATWHGQRFHCCNRTEIK